MILNTIGTVLLSLTTVSALVGFLVSGVSALKRGGEDSIKLVTLGMKGSSTLLLLLSLFLIFSFLFDRFEISYVAYNSSRGMPFYYKISAFWGSLNGSLLLWAVLLSLYGLFFALREKDLPPPVFSVVIAVVQFVLLFFLSVTLGVANPFLPVRDERGEIFLPHDGLGMNPILQHPAMAIHPPLLYLGFTGFTLPFGLMVGNLFFPFPHIVPLLRFYSMIPWVFLSGGILMGASWAYMELGWGGYWGWDPVENSSLLPWLLATAYIHSLQVEERKNCLKGWNHLLIFLTFILTILGTFLTRSGILVSVHAFAEGEIGHLFLGFFLFLLFGGTVLLLVYWDRIRSQDRIQKIVSREGAFLLNNVLFTGLTFSIFWGMIYPLLYELLTGQRITIGAVYFQRITYPLTLILLPLIGLGMLIPWSGGGKFFRRIGFLFLLSACIGGVFYLFLPLTPSSLFFYTFLIFSFLAVGEEFRRGISAIRRRHHFSFFTAFLRLFSWNRRRYGGYLAHGGVLLFLIGVGGGFFNEEKEFVLRPGESKEVLGHQFTLHSLTTQEGKNYLSRMALVELSSSEETFFMWPEKRTYLDLRQEKSTEVAILSGFLYDLYLIFMEERGDGTVLFRFHRNPLVFFVWLGGVVTILGGFVALSGKTLFSISKRKEVSYGGS
jgi:cytochrome c-type biogenesis protein CcmF